MILGTSSNSLFAQDESLKPDRKVVYKKVGDVELKLHVFEKDSKRKDRPAIVFFFGGGWNGGDPSQFYPHCRHLSELGFVAMSAEYRVKSRNKTTPFDAVADAKAAVRWVYRNAKAQGIDPKKIVASGGPASPRST